MRIATRKIATSKHARDDALIAHSDGHPPLFWGCGKGCVGRERWGGRVRQLQIVFTFPVRLLQIVFKFPVRLLQKVSKFPVRLLVNYVEVAG